MKQRNYTDGAGASRLKSIIVAYWSERGYHPPEVRKSYAGFDPSTRATRVDIRSDMLNGYPRKKV